MPRRALLTTSFFALWALAAAPASSDWPEVRGPDRNGRSSETGLPETWSPEGENLLFRAPFGGRSTPVVLGDVLYLQTGVGEGETRQERLLALDAGTGDVIWEQRRNIFHSDAPPRRVGWASPAVDAATGSVFMFTVGGGLHSFDAGDGTPRWERSLPEEAGLISTHGGRTASPIVLDGVVIVSALSSSWGSHARGSQRFFGFDAGSGRMVWMSAPGGRPFDTTYAPVNVQTVAGRPTLLAGGGDGAFHGLDPNTGASAWRHPMSKRGVNSGAVVAGGLVMVSHGEENLESSVMGLRAALDPSRTSEDGAPEVRWATPGFLGGFSSPVTNGETVWQVDNSANLTAYRATDGEALWTHNLGTIQRASPVYADGRLYVGTVNGDFYILRPGADGVEVLDEDRLGADDPEPEAILASVAVSDGVVYLVSDGGLYAIGERRPTTSDEASGTTHPETSSGDAAVRLRLSPTEEILAPGDEAELSLDAFDAAGRRTAAPTNVSFEVAGFAGSVEDGVLRVDSGAPGGAGTVTASAGGLRAEARFRVVPPLPWRWDFDDPESAVPPQWVNAAGKYETRTLDDGSRVLAKRADNPFLRRARIYMGPPDLGGYTVSADVMARERRRQLGNVGLVAQRYQLVLMGSHQRLEIHSWQATPGRTIQVPFAWEPDVWYRMKFEVSEAGNGEVVARGRVWRRDESEPEAWSIEWSEPHPHRQGTPGVFADAVAAEIFFDDIRVEPGAVER